MVAATQSPKRMWLAEAGYMVYRVLPLPIYGVLLAATYLVPPLRKDLGTRLGMNIPAGLRRPLIWFHASSVGEISTVAPVVNEMAVSRPYGTILVTTMTAGGRRRAQRLIKTATTMLVPLDFYPAVRRAMSVLAPSALIIGETEIWPNLVRAAKEQGAAVVMLNGRISDRSLPWYRLIGGFLRAVLANFDLLLMRTPSDAERILQLGANPAAVRVAGNTKYDILPAPSTTDDRAVTRQWLGLSDRRSVITLGSAREGECEILLEALREVDVRPAPVKVIAPRHLGLVPQIEQVCRDFGYTYAAVGNDRARRRESDADPQVIIVAEMGRLLEVYAVSDIAIVGGTFKPFGGHNPLEPASQGVVTVVGPYIQNIVDDIEYLRSRDCALVVKQAQLGKALQAILTDGPWRQQMGERAIQAVKDRKGISKKCLAIMEKRGLLP